MVTAEKLPKLFFVGSSLRSTRPRSCSSSAAITCSGRPSSDLGSWAARSGATAAGQSRGRNIRHYSRAASGVSPSGPNGCCWFYDSLVTAAIETNSTRRPPTNDATADGSPTIVPTRAGHRYSVPGAGTASPAAETVSPAAENARPTVPSSQADDQPRAKRASPRRT